MFDTRHKPDAFSVGFAARLVGRGRSVGVHLTIRAAMRDDDAGMDERAARSRDQSTKTRVTSMGTAGTVLPGHYFNTLLIENNPIEVWVTGFEHPFSRAVLV